MAIVNSRVRWKTKGDVNFTDIQFETLSVTKNINADSTMLDIEFKNGYNHFASVATGSTFFTAGDVIEVYVSNDSIDIDTEDAHIIGSVKEVNYVVAEKSTRVRLSLQDRTSILLNLRIVMNYKNQTAPQIIQNVIQKVNESVNPDDFLLSSIGYNPAKVDATRPNGTQFPQRDLTLIWKTAYEWIKQVSQVEFLNTEAENASQDLVVTKPFFFYVDKSNDLVWHNRQDSVYDKDSDPIYANQEGVYELKMKKSTFGTFNMVIFNAGTDKTGSGIWWYNYDTNSKDSELRISVQSFVDIADGYRNDLLVKDNLKSTTSNSITVEANTVPVTNINVFESGGGYALVERQEEYIYYSSTDSNTSTLTGVQRAKFNTPNSSHSSGVLIHVADSYGDKSNDDFRDWCKDEGKRRSEAMFQGIASLRWKGSIKVRGTNTYQVGDQVPIYATDLGLTGQKLRVTSITDTVDANGWNTSLQFEEDPPEQGAGGAT
jgi:hypothetical protein